MLKWFIGLGIFWVPLLGVLFTGSSVSAASDFDGEILTTTTLELRSPDGTYIEDITNSFPTYIVPDEHGCNIERMNKINAALDTGASFMLNRHLVNSTLENSVYAVYGQPAGNTKVEFLMSGGQPYVYFEPGGMTDAVIVNWYLNNNGEINVQCFDFFGLSDVIGWGQTMYSSNGIPFIFYNSFAISYPAGYEGEEIPDSYEDASDYNAGGGFNPTSDFWVDNLDFEIIDTTEQALIESFEIDLCIFQLPDNTYGDTFTEYIYDCNSPIKVEHTFPELGSYNVIQRMYSSEDDLWYESTLVVKIDGTSYTGRIGDISAGLFENCLKSEFPFVDINACIENVKAVGSLLSFNSIAFGNYDFSNECRNLEVLGFWLNLENKTVCPQVPASIRNIITPFVTFIFGLLGLKFITNRGEGGFN